MIDSHYQQDIQIEEKIGKWLDQYFYSNSKLFTKSYREKDIANQNKGIDMIVQSPIIFSDNQEHKIDEKTAIYYVKNDVHKSSLPTFAFELDYFKNGVLKDGWLFGDKYEATEYFLIMWIWANVEVKSNHDNKFPSYKCDQINSSNILKMEGYFIHKKKVRNYAKLVGANVNNFKELRNTKTLDNGIVASKIYVSENLNERPMNLVIKKIKLKELASAIFTCTPQKINLQIKQNGKWTNIM